MAAHAFENIPEGEAAEIEEIARLTTELQDKRKDLPEQGGKLLRGVHPKSHGCISAQFIINADIEEKYQVGLFFTPGKTYCAHVRFSNASVKIEADSTFVSGDTPKWEHASRGMAIKVYNVEGEIIEADNGQHNQDFLMINTPEFAFADVRSYGFLTRSLSGSEFGNDPTTLFALGKISIGIMTARGATSLVPTQQDFDGLKGFLDSENNAGNFQLPDGFSLQDLQEIVGSLLLLTQNIQKLTVRNPLQAQYFGASPYLFGDNKVMKFSAAPSEVTLQATFATNPAETVDDNFLREAVSNSMQQGQSLEFDFKILVKDAEDDFGEDKILIENATTTWKEGNIEEVEQYVSVAKLIIAAPQNPASADTLVHCENLAFTPWHSLAEHKPIGGINRLRRSVYSNSAEHRKNIR